jgi:hypothetical protein
MSGHPPDPHRVALHEAAHIVVGEALGGEPGGVTIEAGSHLGGCSRVTFPPAPEDAWTGLDVFAPFAVWPFELRQRIERQTLMLAAGGAAEEVLYLPRPSRGPGPVTDRAEELAVSLPAPTGAERSGLSAAVDDVAIRPDVEKIAELARCAHGPDLPSLGTWLSHVEAQARALVLAHEDRIRRLADVLAEVRTLGSEALAAVLREQP